MKRRQVITGLLAAGAMGVLPHSAHRAMRSNKLLTDQYSIDPATLLDVDPPLFDPVSDHENRSVLIPPSVIQPLASPIQQTTELASAKQSVVGVSELIKGDITLPNEVAVSTVELQLEKVPVHIASNAEHVNTPITTPTNAVSTQQAHINKAIYFEQDYADDIFISTEESPLLYSVHLRLKKLQSQVGYGHFNILNFDDALTFAKRYSAVGRFTPAELEFIEDIFSRNATDYGFYGEKVIASLTSTIKKPQAFKVPHTGHYLFKEQSIQYYEKLRKHVGEGIVLTSGIRSNVKQLHLFLAKVVRVNGNLSRASRSLAPPGYSYHGVGDFDVGRKGWGGKNFTDAFSQTDEFKRMQDLGYVTIRYDEGNTLGVRFEPWHIKVV
jgi:zinc D-Ala-D-Ala carboxypeptidase